MWAATACRAGWLVRELVLCVAATTSLKPALPRQHPVPLPPFVAFVPQKEGWEALAQTPWPKAWVQHMPAFTDKHPGPHLPSTKLGAGASSVANKGGEVGGEGQGQ